MTLSVRASTNRTRSISTFYFYSVSTQNVVRLLRNSASEREILHSHGAQRRLSKTACVCVCVCERGGDEVREIFEIIYRNAHYGSEPRNGETLISILTTASNSWRYIEEQAPLVPSTPLATFSAWTSSIFGDIMFSGCVREATYDPVFGLV